MRICLADYTMDREKVYGKEFTEEIKSNAEKTVALTNALLNVLETAGIPLEAHPVNRSVVASGWRPPQINRQVPNAALRSKHMTAQAIDLYDPDGLIDEYLLAHPEPLHALGLYQEHPSATKGWAHVQIVPPKSGRRVFYP